MSAEFCSFCQKSSEQSAVMIEGPNSIFICDECIALCSKVVVDSASKAIRARVPEPSRSPSHPKEEEQT